MGNLFYHLVGSICCAAHWSSFPPSTASIHHLPLQAPSHKVHNVCIVFRKLPKKKKKTKTIAQLLIWFNFFIARFHGWTDRRYPTWTRRPNSAMRRDWKGKWGVKADLYQCHFTFHWTDTNAQRQTDTFGDTQKHSRHTLSTNMILLHRVIPLSCKTVQTDRI